jgi:(p)ppGpp synthase/HD superfamily hydrolase
MATLGRAVAIAAEAHQSQTDKAGAPYILHPLRVMQRMDTEAEKIAAILHDVVEDSTWTIEQLRAEGFSEEILAAIDCLTKHEGESYDEFILRASSNPLARKVKLADLEDNLDLRRLGELTEKDLQRIQKYHRVWQSLTRNSDDNMS